ncbi:uncharacterized protein LOC107217868 [Neodiprion lecontei]|uniref:Uncharacterized protein LOC107217868 n=1 Tax=Neodiprion lecontei TaxID=441921 RepID=A0A6J0B7R2_NEOLC|nr:uncharacterized protein LOC107217868 [Neodiprion lecontei]
MSFALLVAGAYALATLRRYSVAQTATLTTFALFLTSSLTPLSAAPAGLGHAEMREEPWIHSCGAPVTDSPNQRHNLYRTLKRVHTQFKVAWDYFHAKNDIAQIYSKVTKELKTQYSLPWLPKGQLEWYHKEAWCLEKAKKAQIALPKLHDTLQRFAITFYHLKSFELDSHFNTNARGKRNKIIEAMYHNIIRMLCEVETAIVILGIELPSSYEAAIVTESPDWTEKGDFTRMLVQDSGVIQLYKGFLRDWMVAFWNLAATLKDTKVCDPLNPPPLETIRRRNKQGKKGKNVRVQKSGRRNKRPGQGRGQRRGSRRKLTGNKQRKTE